MAEKIKTESRYHEIAVLIAEKIADGTYPEGTRISSRTTISTQFGVSPETARKAITILADMGIMEARHGSGTYVSSREKASFFVDRYSDVRTIREIRQEIRESVKEQQRELEHFEKLIAEMEKMTARSKLALAFSPYEILISKECIKMGLTVGQMNIWHFTGATIVAIKRGEEYLISPGPQAEFLEGDTVYYVGDVLAKQRMQSFLYGAEEV